MRVESLTEQLFYSTVRIVTWYEDGRSGAGTGFVYGHVTGESVVPFIVTNKHVVEGAEGGQVCLHQGIHGQLVEGRHEVEITPWHTTWFGHPDPNIDISVCPLTPLENYINSTQSRGVFYRAVDSGILPTDAELAELDAIEPVTFIGYPNNIWDEINGLPIARRGHTATPLQHDFEDRPVFIIDASVFGGSSGSPVFVIHDGVILMKRAGTIQPGSRIHFVGVVSAVYFRSEQNEVEAAPVPVTSSFFSRYDEMIDLGVVVKARVVIETIEAYLASLN